MLIKAILAAGHLTIALLLAQVNVYFAYAYVAYLGMELLCSWLILMEKQSTARKLQEALKNTPVMSSKEFMDMLQKESKKEDDDTVQ